VLRSRRHEPAGRCDASARSRDGFRARRPQLYDDRCAGWDVGAGMRGGADRQAWRSLRPCAARERAV